MSIKDRPDIEATNALATFAESLSLSFEQVERIRTYTFGRYFTPEGSRTEADQWQMQRKLINQILHSAVPQPYKCRAQEKPTNISKPLIDSI